MISEALKKSMSCFDSSDFIVCLMRVFMVLQVQDLFRMEYGEVFEVPLPTRQERTRFFEDLILNQAAKAPASKRKAGWLGDIYVSV